MRESQTLEFKETVSNTFLKTVSAFANYNGGTILFGVRDDGTPVGVEHPNEVCLAIENKTNDSIRPQPNYSLEVRSTDNVVSLTVKPGKNTPYTYKSKFFLPVVCLPELPRKSICVGTFPSPAIQFWGTCFTGCIL